MGLIDRLRRAGGIAKNRLASSVGAIRGFVTRIGRGARGVTVSGARARRGVRFAARGSRLFSPVGIGLTAVAFAPEIVRGVKRVTRFVAPAITRGIAFFGGRQVATAAGAGGVAGFLGSRKKGQPVRPSDFGDPSLQTRLPGARAPGARPRRPTRRRGKRVQRRIGRHRHKVVSIPVTRRRTTRRGRKRTHASPRHRGHKRVSFTTASGKKVSFLVNPKARHR